MQFSELLSAGRKVAGLTQQELADRVGRQAQAILDWEAGRRVPPYEAALAVADAIGVDRSRPDQLTGRTRSGTLDLMDITTLQNQLKALAEDADAAIYAADRPNSPLPEWTVTFHAGRAQAIRDILALVCVPSEA